MFVECDNFEINIIKFETIIAFIFFAIDNEILNNDNMFVYFEYINTNFLLFENCFFVNLIIHDNYKICFRFNFFVFVFVIFVDEIELNLLIVQICYNFKKIFDYY